MYLMWSLKSLKVSRTGSQEEKLKIGEKWKIYLIFTSSNPSSEGELQKKLALPTFECHMRLTWERSWSCWHSQTWRSCGLQCSSTQKVRWQISLLAHHLPANQQQCRWPLTFEVQWLVGCFRQPTLTHMFLWVNLIQNYRRKEMLRDIVPT